MRLAEAGWLSDMGKWVEDKWREGIPQLILLAFVHIAGLLAHMPICSNNVKKRKARRIKNDRLQVAKKAAKAKV